MPLDAHQGWLTSDAIYSRNVLRLGKAGEAVWFNESQALLPVQQVFNIAPASPSVSDAE